MAETQQPAYRAFTVIKREGADDFWLPIGAAFKHQDGEGLNLVLQALPIDGRVVLRVPKEDDGQSGPRQSNNRGKSGQSRR